MIKKIVLTGSSGKAGRAVMQDLLKHDYQVTAVDLVHVPLSERPWHTLRADLTDLGETLEVLMGADAVIHLANIPAPELFTAGRTFEENTLMNYNVFSAAKDLKLKRVVWASSETTLGLPFDILPQYAPIDEAHYPYPESSYALSKVVAETMAEQFSRWSGIPFVGLRLSNVLNETDYQNFPTYWKDALLRKWNLWGYVDERDVALACRLALHADISGSRNYIIAATDTVMNHPSVDLMKEVFPTVAMKKPVSEFETLLSIDKARAELGYEPQHSWRDVLNLG